jgi:hypothetical protein
MKAMEFSTRICKPGDEQALSLVAAQALQFKRRK